MAHRFEIEKHSSELASRCDVKVVQFAAKPPMAVTVNVSAKRIGFQQLPDGAAADSNLAESGIQDAQRGAVRNEHRVCIKQRCKVHQIDLNLRFRLLEHPAHERQ